MGVGSLYTLTYMRSSTIVVTGVQLKERQLYVWVNCIQVIVVLLHILLLETGLSIVHVSVSPPWRMRGSGNSSFLSITPTPSLSLPPWYSQVILWHNQTFVDNCSCSYEK